MVTPEINSVKVSPRLCRGTHNGLTYTAVVMNLKVQPRDETAGRASHHTRQLDGCVERTLLFTSLTDDTRARTGITSGMLNESGFSAPEHQKRLHADATC